MKLVVIADALDFQSAGIHTYVKHLLPQLKSEGLSITLIRPVDDGVFPWTDTVVVPASKLPGHGLYRKFIRIPKIINKIQPDVVLEPAHYGPLWIKKSAKRITVIHDLSALIYPRFHKLSSVLLHLLLLPGVLNNTDHIITVSEHSKKDLCRKFPDTCKKISVTPLGPVLHGSIPPFQNQKPYFLFVGTIEPRKNLILLLNAFEQIRTLGIDCQLVLAGKMGWKSKRFKKALADHPFRSDIILTGYVSDEQLISYYKGAQAFIYPSIYEGFGLPVLDSMRLGCPVLLAENSSLVETGGSAAAFFRTNSLHDLVAQMKKVMENQEFREQLINQGLKQATRFSWEKTGRLTLQVIKDLNKINEA